MMKVELELFTYVAMLLKVEQCIRVRKCHAIHW